MDPNVALKRLLDLVALNGRVPLNPSATDELTDLVEALHDWLAGGGFLPDQWQTASAAASAEPSTLLKQLEAKLDGVVTVLARSNENLSMAFKAMAMDDEQHKPIEGQGELPYLDRLSDRG